MEISVKKLITNLNGNDCTNLIQVLATIFETYEKQSTTIIPSDPSLWAHRFKTQHNILKRGRQLIVGSSSTNKESW